MDFFETKNQMTAAEKNRTVEEYSLME